MNISRYFWTVTNLKPVQIRYQLKYRLFGYKKVKTKKCPNIKTDFDISIKALDEDEKYIRRFMVDEILNNRIHLLNESTQWRPGKWNYPEKTHLWNFNLHYFEYGIALAATYEKTKAEKYYMKMVELYENWHEVCFKSVSGDAWHPYTISLRLKNLLIIYGILTDKNDDWISLVKQDIYDQYLFLLANTENNLLGNHYFENLTTLFLCSIFFGDRKNQISCYNCLLREIKEQILPDGMHFERSFMYHNLILEDLLRTYKVADALYQRMVKSHISAMVKCVSEFEYENRIPAFNDAGSNVSKRRAQLLQAASDLIDIKLNDCNALNDGGYYRFEHGVWMMIVDAGEYAPKYISGHGQCDMLSFELFCNDEPILVNSGTYQYQSDLRSYFRSTKAHNTLQINGIEQSEIWGEHRTGRCAHITNLKNMGNAIWATIKDYRGNRLERKIIVDDEIQIIDSASSPYTSYWHIHPGNKVLKQADGLIEIVTPGGTAIALESDVGVFDDISDECHYSENFGEIKNLPSYKKSKGKIFIRIKQ